MLLIGAGEMAELAMAHLLGHRVGEITVANRTLERGMALARRFNGKAIPFDECPSQLKTVDIIISSTGGAGYVLDRGQVEPHLHDRHNQPLLSASQHLCVRY